MISGDWRTSRGRSSSVDKGGDLGLGHVGSRVINTLRIEKGEDNKMIKVSRINVSTLIQDSEPGDVK